MDGARLAQWVRTGFVVLVLIVAIFAAISADDFRRAARLFPQYAGGLLALLCALELSRQLLRRKAAVKGAGPLNTADIGLDADEASIDGWKRALGVMGWIIGYMIGISLIGIALATALFIPALLWFRFKAPLWISLGLVAGLWVLMWALRVGLSLRLPSGVLLGSFPF